MNLMECNHNHPDCYCALCVVGTIYCTGLSAPINKPECPFYKTVIQFQLTDATPDRRDRRYRDGERH